MGHTSSDIPPDAAPPSRRSFVTVAATLATGALAVLTPLAAGLSMFISPLSRKRQEAASVRVALLDQVPADGMPRSFPVLSDRTDAWNRYPAQRIGAVYLVRNAGEQKPTAFTAKCPHAGCFIGYTPGEDTFKCPCHTSAFQLDGTRVRGDAEVSPRDMDALKVELRTIAVAGAGDAGARSRTAGVEEVTEVWVQFVDFQTGSKERIPTA